MVGVKQRNIGPRLRPMNCDVTDFDLRSERDDVEAADFGMAARDAFHLRDHLAAHVVLKGIGGDVPQGDADEENSGPAHNQQIFPPPSFLQWETRLGGGLSHRDCTPSFDEPRAKLSLLSERSDCSHETSSSLTFSSVSSSRILPVTASSGTCPEPVCFNCGTNLSR